MMVSEMSVFSVICLLYVEHCYAVVGLVANVGQQYNVQTENELACQKMSNETNEVLVNVQNEVDQNNNPNETAALPDDVVDYINDNAIIITGVTDGGEGGTFSPISTDDKFNEGQLQAIKGQFDIMSTSYSDSNSKYQLELQVALQALTQSITAISQTMSKSNQVITQIVSNFK
ncbi:hypothetical protein UQ49_05795 [Salmonella enterica subsp. diarizonae]|nr:hypothetical protein UQ50_05790 [Salmonella enterica subsp. diarizonae]ANA24240.1 hypothetical protein UQ48_05790 [Salmonella enterica subsp. diarizonae]ANA28581.1 hypothetical protein UQ49_05795 [Salmonella enterica subsp. diarizonae]ASG84831.1 hypothetical protein LFZ55_18920 [Salmonella enterica subsp. diarizonae serovar 65:c:z str. SA20044251]ATW55904.1 hypothetical protein CNQ75_16080 [Salmonella enterica subsp. diarizonae]